MDHLPRTFDVVGFDVDTIDITNIDAVAAHVKRVQPDVVIHAAAFTDVDGCETQEETAMAVNSEGTRNVAAACHDCGARLIYYSTDYVFDGQAEEAYTEDDLPNPQTVYGRSKLAGERAVAAALEEYAIMRISWVYGEHGTNFVKTMLKLGRAQRQSAADGKTVDPIKVVNDQVGNPTWTRDVVRQTVTVIDRRLTGLFHATAEGICSWYQLARDTFEFRRMNAVVEPCSSDEFPRRAVRPALSALENARLKAAGANDMRDYRVALKEFCDDYEE